MQQHKITVWFLHVFEVLSYLIKIYVCLLFAFQINFKRHFFNTDTHKQYVWNETNINKFRKIINHVDDVQVKWFTNLSPQMTWSFNFVYTRASLLKCHIYLMVHMTTISTQTCLFCNNLRRKSFFVHSFTSISN